MRPLRLPGLDVTTSATILVEAIPAGLRYTTEGVSIEYAGAFSGPLSQLQPKLTAVSEVRVVDTRMLKMDTEFLLKVPLPQWWPLPDSVDAVGSNLIRGIVQKDTQQSITRVKAEFAAWSRTRAGVK